MESLQLAWQDAIRGTLQGETDFDKHWQNYQDAFANWPSSNGPPPAWVPDSKTLAQANLTQLAEHVGVAADEVHAWSVANRAHYWSAVMELMQIPFATPPTETLDDSKGPAKPTWLPGAQMNISAACWDGAPDAPAIIASSEETGDLVTVTYGELRAKVNAIHHGLTRAGFSAGDAIALYMPMTTECVVAYLAIVQAGMVVVSIPDSFAPDEVRTRLRLGNARAIITVQDFLRGSKRVPMAPKAREAAGDLPCVIVGDGELQDGDIAWSSLASEPEPVAAVNCDPYTTTNILFSSGTTGEPKAIPWNHLTPIKAAADGFLHQDIHEGEVVAWPTNIGWMMGPWLIYATLVNRGTIALFEGAPTGNRFMQFLRDARVKMLGLVPAIVRAWREGGVLPGALPDVRVFSSTGEASNSFDYLYLMSLANYQAPIIEYCGGTEIGGGHVTGSVLRPASPATFSTPAMGIDFVVLDEGKHTQPGQHGQIFLLPPSIGLSQSLLNRDHDEEYYADLPAGPEGQVLRRHGDEMHVLGNGYWAAGGRADDTMNLGGIKVSSIELEAAMNQHASVSETAAVAVRPPQGGADLLVVFAVAATNPKLQAELQALIKTNLNPLFRIHDVVCIDKLPRTASNKVMRRELRAQYAAT